MRVSEARADRIPVTSLSVTVWYRRRDVQRPLFSSWVCISADTILTKTFAMVGDNTQCNLKHREVLHKWVPKIYFLQELPVSVREQKYIFWCYQRQSITQFCCRGITSAMRTIIFLSNWTSWWIWVRLKCLFQILATGMNFYYFSSLVGRCFMFSYFVRVLLSLCLFYRDLCYCHCSLSFSGPISMKIFFSVGEILYDSRGTN